MEAFGVLPLHRAEEARREARHGLEHGHRLTRPRSFQPRPYTDRDGNDRVANEVDRFYDWDEKFFPVTGEFTDVTDSDLPF